MAFQSDAAYAKIRESILSTAMQPGTRLTEVALSEQLGVSRFAVREALRRLHGERLVTRIGARYAVPFVTEEDVQQIAQLRFILETGALRCLSGGLAPELLHEIGEAAGDYEELVKKRYFAGALEADLRFHRALVAAARNPRLSDAYQLANLPLLHVTAGRHPLPLDDFPQAAAEHRAIYSALKRKQLGKAVELLEGHLKRGERDILERSRGKPERE